MQRCKALVLLAALVLLVTSHAAAASPRFDAEQTVIWRGRTQVIAFHLDQPAATNLTLDTQAGDAKSLTVVDPATILAGQTIGYVRVRGLVAGASTLKVGDSTLKVTIAEPTARASEGALTPELLGPAAGTFLWGVMDFAVTTPADFAAVSPGIAKAQLKLPDGTLLDAAATPRIVGSRRVWRFSLDIDKQPVGPLTLTPVATDKVGARYVGDARQFVVIRPTAATLVAGECEALLTADWKERYEQDPPRVGSHPDASDGAFVANYSADPMWRMPVKVEQAGMYQMVMRARGDRAAGALPAIGVVIGREQQPTVAGNLIDEGWHRVPVGPAFSLDKGDHVLGVRFFNDFYAPNRADRNLLLDRYELLRIGTAEEAGRLAKGAPQLSVEPTVRDPLRIGFMSAFDSLPINGRLTIKGLCWQPDAKTAAPRVSLLINGKVISTQQAMEPMFWVDAMAFQKGSNTVQLTASLADGRTAMTPVQSVEVIDELAPRVQRPARRFLRFDVEDEAWSRSTAERWNDKDRAGGHDVALFESDGKITLKLPADLAGEFEVYLDARGEGAPVPKLSLTHLVNGTAKDPQNIDGNGWWRPREAGAVTLKPGRNELELTVTGADKAHRTWVGSLILYERVDGLDRSPPRVRMRYPAEGQDVAGADAVIVEAMDDDRLTEVDLLIDGVPQALNLTVEGQAGRFAFPLLTGELSPGSHRLAVRVRDQGGNVGETREVTVNVVDTATAPSRYARAVHLLNRLGYGPEPDELAAVLLLGERAYVADRLSRRSDEQTGAGDLAAMGFAATRYPEVTGEYQVQHRVIQQGISTNNPLRYRFVMFSQNHFSTWIRKTEAAAKWEEHLRFNRLGAAPFGELLLASATSPAMLWYLDQQRSFAGAINENYAREIMELHTLGVHGGYTQEDVTALAHLISGWGAADEAPASGRGFPYARTFYFDEALNQAASQRIIGAKFERTATDAAAGVAYDRARYMLEVLAAHPSTARHIATKLAEHYVAAPAPPAMVEQLTTTFHSSGGDMQAMMLAMIDHADFWKQMDQPRLAKPMSYALRISRVPGGDNPWQVGQCLSNSGVMLFDRATPDGYPDEDAPYADSNAMLQRWQFARNMEWTLWRLVPGPWIGNERDGRAMWARRLSNFAAVRLTGKPLSEQSLEACVQFAEQGEGAAWERGLQLVTFVAQLPEASEH